MWFRKRNSVADDELSMMRYLFSRKLWLSKEFWLSVFLAIVVYAINLHMVRLMNKDSVAITFLLLLCFALSTVWRLALCRDREGWFLIIVPLSDFATVIFALACISTIADPDFHPAMMKAALKMLAGFICGIYGFSLCREILSIEYDKSKRR